jgi:hypothetical protein
LVKTDPHEVRPESKRRGEGKGRKEGSLKDKAEEGVYVGTSVNIVPDMAHK